MIQILGNLYTRDREISKSYLEIKELTRKVLFKALGKQDSSFSLNEFINHLINNKGYKDCNLPT
ncbi:hypothetical protein ACI3PL_26360, partial [Lacticaseibacillus paracasei]